MFAMVVAALVFFVWYALVWLFLRLQYKLAIVFVLLDQRRLDFQKVNSWFVYCLHVTLLFIGGFGWVSLFYIDI